MKRIPLRRVIAIALVAAVGVWFWRYGIRDNVTPENFGVVKEGAVYRSAALTPAALRHVQAKYGIRTIVDLGAYEPGTPGWRRAEAAADALGITRYTLDLEGDGTGNPNDYVAALRVMADSTDAPVLVHCSAGAQRTGCLVMLYRKIFEGVPYDRSLTEARRHKHDPADNPRLREMIDRWGDRIEAAYRAGGWIDGMPVPAWASVEPADPAPGPR